MRLGAYCQEDIETAVEQVKFCDCEETCNNDFWSFYNELFLKTDDISDSSLTDAFKMNMMQKMNTFDDTAEAACNPIVAPDGQQFLNEWNEVIKPFPMIFSHD